MSFLDTFKDEVKVSVNVFATSIKYRILHQYYYKFVVNVESYQLKAHLQPLGSTNFSATMLGTMMQLLS